MTPIDANLTLVTTGIDIGMYMVLGLIERRRADLIERLCTDTGFAEDICSVIRQHIKADMDREEEVTTVDVEHMLDSVVMLGDMEGAS